MSSIVDSHSAAPTVAFSAERVAETLRREVLAGALGADARIKDAELAQRFEVSRNTAREALRLLAAQGLVVLRLHSGAAVRRLDIDEVRDIYRVRRTLECSAVQNSSRAHEQRLLAVERAVVEAEEHLARDEWAQAATASLGVHTAIVGLLESPSMSRFFDEQLAQLRIAFWALPIDTEFQTLWIPRDREIADLLLGGKRELAARALLSYIDDSEARVLDAMRAEARASRI
ncbi:GntR family transcriptional regulator [Antrihabitans sp. YC2-6]|uniref:GntR family transcriptional regulator n=1 Tax=Antrihabitans sp. YC2-6 TaxID=2799498 RepID=UPI0018F3F0FA|nr:GntR family transcriptional regulator [Antrihabitans sp. YC2-6]MBJ8344323.1 GntR family transcriptional regulator [Antrihabitans sp. YC2-6]